MDLMGLEEEQRYERVTTERNASKQTGSVRKSRAGCTADGSHWDLLFPLWFAS